VDLGSKMQNIVNVAFVSHDDVDLDGAMMLKILLI